MVTVPTTTTDLRKDRPLHKVPPRIQPTGESRVELEEITSQPTHRIIIEVNQVTANSIWSDLRNYAEIDPDDPATADDLNVLTMDFLRAIKQVARR